MLEEVNLITRYGNYELDDDGIIPIYSKLGMEDGLTAKINHSK